MLKLIDIGIVLQSAEGLDFRDVILRDMDSLSESKYILYKSKQPYLWKTIEKAEDNTGKIVTLSGKIQKYNGIDIIVFDGENIADSFEKQMWKYKDQKVIKRSEVKDRINESEGYKLDSTFGNAMLLKTQEPDLSAKKIKFRYFYKANTLNNLVHSHFKWTNWFDIIDG